MSRYHDGKTLKNRAHNNLPLPADGVGLETFIPWRYVRRTCRKEVITPIDAPQAFEKDAQQERAQHRKVPVSPLQRALGLAHHWQRLLDERRVASLGEIAEAEGINVTQVRRLLRLTLLAPQIIESLACRPHTTLEHVIRRTWPATWSDQTLK